MTATYDIDHCNVATAAAATALFAHATFVTIISTEQEHLSYQHNNNNNNNEIALGETQMLRAGRSNAEPKNFVPPQTPFPWAQDRQKSAGDGHYLHLQTQFGEDRCT